MISTVKILALCLLCSPFVIFCDQAKSGDKEPFLKNNNAITQRPLILFDAFKEQAWSIKDTGFAGYSSLNLFLKNLGYRTAENHKPYDEVLPGLGPETLFVICVAMEARFTGYEIKEVLDFVIRGGKVLIIAEHDNQYESTNFLWPIINAGGWEINHDRVIDHNNALPDTEGMWIRTVLPSKKEGPVFLCAASLRKFRRDECEVLLTSFDGNNIVAGLGRYKNGPIAILGDSEFLWNGNPDYKWKGLYQLAFSEPKTKAFIKDLILRIHPLPGPKKASDFPCSSTRQNQTKVYVYGNGEDFESYSRFLTALTDANISVYKYQKGITPADRVIVISPLKTIPQHIVDDLSKSKKAVIFGDMYSSIKSYADSWELFFGRYEMHPVAYPANALAEKYGVRFLPFFGVNFNDNEHKNILYIPVFFQKKKLHLHRACAIELLTGDRNKEISFQNSKGTFACGAGFGLNDPLKSIDPNDMQNPDFLVVTDNVFAIGDSDIIDDVFFHEAELAGIIDEIINFLK